MILDHIDNARMYFPLGERFELALRWMQTHDVASLSLGRHDVDGDRVFALVQEVTTKAMAAGVWEAHRRYADIQAPLSGPENIGYAHLPQLAVTQAFDEAKDFCLLAGNGTLLTLQPGMFTILLPQDGHMPGVAVGEPKAIKKVVMKIML